MVAPTSAAPVVNLPQVVRLGDIPADLAAEKIATLATGAHFRFEHIYSGSYVSPPDFWYDQAQAEWAVLLAGSATLEFEAGMLAMTAGDAVLIPAHLKHRVARSSHAVWLALHFESPL